jgi:KDO2-lipid IV(A) lauroyltransferase
MARRRLQGAKNTLIFCVVVSLMAVLRGLLFLLPHRGVVRLGSAVGALAGVLGRRERHRAEKNVGLGLPLLPIEERHQLVNRMFRNLGRSALECVAMRRIRPKLLDERGPVQFEDGSLSTLESAVGQGRGVIYVTCHLGNWELMAAAVAQRFPVSVLYKPSYDPRFTRIINRFRNDNGVRGVEVGQSGHLRRAIRALREGRVLGILLDQPVPNGDTVSFFGNPAPTSQIVPALEAVTGAIVVIGTIRRVAPCQHAISVLPFTPPTTAQSRRSLTQALTTTLEEAISKDPDQWIWSLDRWRSTESRTMSRPVAADCKLYTSE